MWLADIPVATLKPSGATVAIYYVHSDALNTPRQITRPSDNTVMWTWNSDPFGTDAANPNPSEAGFFTSGKWSGTAGEYSHDQVWHFAGEHSSRGHPRAAASSSGLLTVGSAEVFRSDRSPAARCGGCHGLRCAQIVITHKYPIGQTLAATWFLRGL